MLLRIRFLVTWKNFVVTRYKVSHNGKPGNNVITTFMRNLNVPKNNVRCVVVTKALITKL